MSKNDARQAIDDMVGDLRSTFKKYGLSARRKAWKGLISPEGKRQVDQLILDPKKPVVGLSKLVSFKEWLTTVHVHAE